MLSFLRFSAPAFIRTGIAGRLVCYSMATALLPVPVWAAAVPKDIGAAFARARIPLSDVALYVKVVKDKRPRLAHRPDVAMNPASTMKLVTTYAGLSLLGPVYTWGTDVHVNGSLQHGVLQGDLILRGGGDPRLNLERMWLMLRELQSRGVKEIRGDVVLDRVYWSQQALDANAFDGAGHRSYNVPPDAFLANFQSVRLRIRDEAGVIRVQADPALPELKLDAKLIPGNGECGDWREQLNISTEPIGSLTVSGIYPSACGERNLYLSALTPPDYLRELLKTMWHDLGGKWTGSLRDGQLAAFPDSHLLTRFESVPLAEVVRDINKFSNNTQARMLFLALGGEFQPIEQLLPQAADRVRHFLDGQGIPTTGLALDNGSGLSRDERITAGQLGMLLEKAVNSPVGPELIASLPIVGMDGTMKKRLTDTAVTAKAHVKTGSLNGVRAVAGIVHRVDGPVVVVGIVNHPRAFAATDALDQLIEWAGKE